MKLKKIITGVVIGTIVFCGLPFANSASPNMTIGTCLKGNFELDAFLQTVISQHGFADSFIEYWKDLLFRNQCQSMDILNLSKQQDTVQKQIQTAFLECKREKIPALEKAYYKIDAEIYYVRRLVTVGSYAESFSIDLTASDEEQNEKDQIYLNDMTPVYADLKYKYQDKIGGADAFNNFYSTLTVKYSERKYSYISCPDNSWQAVSDKIQEFLTTWGGVKEGYEGSRRYVVGEVERLKRTATTRPPSTFGTFLENTFTAQLNDVSPEAGFKDIMDRLDKLSLSTEAPSLSDVANSVSTEGDVYKAKIDRAKAEAKYKALYLHTTDSATREFIDATDQLLEAIIDGENYIDGVNTCTVNVLNRQCP